MKKLIIALALFCSAASANSLDHVFYDENGVRVLSAEQKAELSKQVGPEIVEMLQYQQTRAAYNVLIAKMELKLAEAERDKALLEQELSIHRKRLGKANEK